MALQVQGSFELNNGLQLTEVYVRTNAALSLDGSYVMAYPEFWVDAPAFAERKDNLNIRIREDFNYAYNREVDGADILTFANEKVKETLEALGYSATIVDI